MVLMTVAEFAATGSDEISAFHTLVVGKMGQPLAPGTGANEAFAPALVDPMRPVAITGTMNAHRRTKGHTTFFFRSVPIRKMPSWSGSLSLVAIPSIIKAYIAPILSIQQ
jgi:hypothetical protein